MIDCCDFPRKVTVFRVCIQDWKVWYGPFSDGSFSGPPVFGKILVGNISKVTDWLTIYDSRLALGMNLRRFFFEQPPSEKASIDPQDSDQRDDTMWAQANPPRATTAETEKHNHTAIITPTCPAISFAVFSRYKVAKQKKQTLLHLDAMRTWKGPCVEPSRCVGTAVFPPLGSPRTAGFLGCRGQIERCLRPKKT